MTIGTMKLKLAVEALKAAAVADATGTTEEPAAVDQAEQQTVGDA